MPPYLALSIWVVLFLALLYFDPGKEAGTSSTLWLPAIWMFLLATRNPSEWFGYEPEVGLAQALQEGNPLDRIIFFVLIFLAVVILASRSFQWGTFFARNTALAAFILFALLSVLWSDFPFVAFKRWFRDLGNYLAVLVVLSDPRPLAAVRAVLRRLCYATISLSVLLIKYFPGLSRSYDTWSGRAYDAGAATSKNTLGMACLISGLFFFWDTVARWSDRKEKRTKRILLVNLTYMAMTLWLLHIADSATSRVCLLIGCLVIAAAHSKVFRRHSGLLKALVPAGFFGYVILAFGFGMNGQFAQAVGRDPTLTDRTVVWSLLLSMHTNPLLGTGYESFWLGPRLERAWQLYGSHGLGEAHNGYLEIYLGLGLLGLLLLAVFLTASYRTICGRLSPFSKFGSFTLGMWTVFLFYNVTEAGFKSGLVWISFLIASITVHERVQDRLLSLSALDNSARAADDFPVSPRQDVEKLVI